MVEDDILYVWDDWNIRKIYIYKLVILRFWIEDCIVFFINRFLIFTILIMLTKINK